MDQTRCLDCLHFLQAETEGNVVTIFCGLSTDGICCFAKNSIDGKVIIFGAQEDARDTWRDAQVAIIAAVEDYDPRSVKMSIADYLTTRMADCTQPTRKEE